jgi:Co/Zn/Cd efflux system component
MVYLLSMARKAGEVEPSHEHGDHRPTYGAVDASITTSGRGIWAVKWSFVELFATALVQIVVVVLSGSVGLLSDTIHNFGDAATAVPLWIAFALFQTKKERVLLRAHRLFPVHSIDS